MDIVGHGQEYKMMVLDTQSDGVEVHRSRWEHTWTGTVLEIYSGRYDFRGTHCRLAADVHRLG